MASLVWQFFVGPLIGLAFGGFPTSYIICKLVKGIDPREFGSGSVSTRNVVRVTGTWWWGILNGATDTIKGATACALVEFVVCYNRSGGTYHPNVDYIVALTGLAAIASHCWMPYLGFKGGKGLATMAGILIYLYWPIGPIIFPLTIALLSMYSGFSGVGALWASTLISPLFFIVDRIPNSQIIQPIPHPFLDPIIQDTLFDIPFTILFAFGVVAILMLRHIPEFKKIKAGEAKIWAKLSGDDIMK
jgi:glycerol-3-phosphate acyltransferase PlsY